MDRRYETKCTLTGDGQTFKVPIDGRLRVDDMCASIAASIGGCGIAMGAQENLITCARPGDCPRRLVDRVHL